MSAPFPLRTFSPISSGGENGPSINPSDKEKAPSDLIWFSDDESTIKNSEQQVLPDIVKSDVMENHLEKNKKTWSVLCARSYSGPEITSEELEKDSDESEYSESGGPYTEKNPLDSGWEYAIFLSYVKSVEEDDYLESVELYTREKYCFGIRIKSQYAEKLRDTVYVRYRQKKTEPGAPYEMFPSRHRRCLLGSLKIRPRKSIEMKPIGVVAFTKYPHCPIPVWSDIVGWQTIDYRNIGAFKKGLVDIQQDEIFKPLRLIEFVIKIRTDLPSQEIPHHPDAVKISDVSPLYLTSADRRTVDIPDYYYPKSPKRIDDLRFEKSVWDNNDERIILKSESVGTVTFWASPDQCAFCLNERSEILSGVFVPAGNNEYRALVVAPIQRLHRLSKAHFLEYKRFPPRKEWSPSVFDKIRRVKEMYSQCERPRRCHEI